MINEIIGHLEQKNKNKYLVLDEMKIFKKF